MTGGPSTAKFGLNVAVVFGNVPVADGYHGATLVFGPKRCLASINGVQKFWSDSKSLSSFDTYGLAANGVRHWTIS